MKALYDTAQKDSEAISKLEKDGRIFIGGKCFKERHLLRTYTGNDHITFIDNFDEYKKFRQEGDILILAQC